MCDEDAVDDDDVVDVVDVVDDDVLVGIKEGLF